MGRVERELASLLSEGMDDEDVGELLCERDDAYARVRADALAEVAELIGAMPATPATVRLADHVARLDDGRGGKG